jgi:malonyl-CoA decarboxylase
MTRTTQSSNGSTNATTSPLDRAKRLASTLLSEGGEASGALLARELHGVLRALDAGGRHGFQRYLATEFQPDTAALRIAAERYLADTTAEAAAALAQAAEPPRQELLRRMNMAPGGTGTLIAMRSEITAHLRHETELKLLDADLKHLFASWFNRGFLELRRIDWQSPAAVLEKLIAYEAVHAIKGWDDLRRRLAPDRRCFAFFHPALPGEPLIFVEVALVKGLATSMLPLLSQDVEEDAARAQAEGADTAIFYSISNCQDGLRGVSFGNFLIKQVVEELQAEFPQLKRFSTLSPVPGFRRWLTQQLAEESNPDAALLPKLARDGWWRDPEQSEPLRAALMRLCATYLTRRKPHRPGSAFSPRQRRAARADQLARQHRAPCDPGILRHHGQLSLRPRQHREQPRSLCAGNDRAFPGGRCVVGRRAYLGPEFRAAGSQEATGGSAIESHKLKCSK